LGDPKVVVEVLSQSTSKYDQDVKLNEYRGLAGLDAVVMVDPDAKRVRLVERTGQEAWSVRWLECGAEVPLPSLGISLSHTEIFVLD